MEHPAEVWTCYFEFFSTCLSTFPHYFVRFVHNLIIDFKQILVVLGLELEVKFLFQKAKKK